MKITVLDASATKPLDAIMTYESDVVPSIGDMIKKDEKDEYGKIYTVYQRLFTVSHMIFGGYNVTVTLSVLPVENG